MRQKEIDDINTMYEYYDYTCFCCDKPAAQRSHIIGNTKLNKRLYGDIIDNPLNWLPACSLKCNGQIDSGRNDFLHERIALVIESKLTENEKHDSIEKIVRKNIKRKEAKIG